MTNIQIWQRLNQMGVNKTLTEINTALATINQQAVFDEQKARFRIEVWDKVSPINGVPAETVLQRQDIPAGGEIYLVYLDGKLQWLQPHDPFQAGLVPLTKDNVMTVADQHVDQFATQMADEKVFEMVLEKVLA